MSRSNPHFPMPTGRPSWWRPVLPRITEESFQPNYIKSKGEVDIAYVDKNQFWPVEVKWSAQLRPKQFKQITKYPNGLILTKSRQQGEIL